MSRIVRPVRPYNIAPREYAEFKAIVDAPVNAWMQEADRLCWSNCAQAQRVAGTELQDIQHLGGHQPLASRRARLAYAEGEIAKARAIAAFIIDPDKRKQARKAINKMARAVREERGA